MKRFRHITAGSVKEVTSILKEQGKKARLVAGGTDLLGELKDRILPEYPEVLVNIKKLPGLDYIREEDGALHIGALTRLEDISRSSEVKKKYSILADAAGRTASPHIREMGSIAGNICQNNRCWYYWVPDNRFDCIRKGGKACYAIIGDGRYHSIFGSTRINGTPCAQACPANVEIPSYMRLLREGQLAAAAELLLSHNPLPAITGRVCPHYCEGECNRDDYDAAVSVRGVERSLGDYVLEHSREMYPTPQKSTGKKVAVIGSGPAGLAAAYYLRQSGHEVTIFERMKSAGGLLTYGIPPYRLPREVVRKQAQALEDTGIQISLNAEIDKKKFTELAKSFDAVFVSCGAWKERDAGITGEQLLISGAKFLRDADSAAQEVKGKKFAIIGGGNVAIDVARTLLRLGAEPVIIYRRTLAEMPAMKEEVEKAQEEKIQIEFLTLPVKAGKSGKQIALTCTRMQLGAPDASGRPRPVPIQGSEFTALYDGVFKAIGEGAETAFLPARLIDKDGNLKIDPQTGAISKNIFAGGDFVTGPSTVVASIAAGKKTAESINRYLGVKSEVSPDAGTGARPDRFNCDFLKKTLRASPPELAPEARIKSLKIEDKGGLNQNQIESEANRCLNCGCVAVNSSDLAPALIALDAKVKTTRRTIPIDHFFAVGVDKSTVLEADEMVLEIILPAPTAGSRSKFIKFALRKSIDFPVVNCAAVISRNGNGVKSARICLNSVYNLPVRVTAAEEYIIGKSINESVAEAAAEAGLKDALPVINNRYKIQIARTLVKRAILACGE